MIQRLDFRLDEFVRVSWVSAGARDKWAPIFFDLSNKFITIERATVYRRARRAALQQTNDIIALGREVGHQGLTVIPLDKVNTALHYMSASSTFKSNQPWEYKVVIAQPSDSWHFLTAYEAGDNEKMAHLLGYPPCCQEFFNKFWRDEAWFDLSLPMVGETDELTIKVAKPDPRNNILLRWLGLRPVSHLPCSFHCEATRVVADLYGAAARLIGAGKEWEKLMEILSWPVEWNSLHGIAQILTPVCKITTASDALPDKRTIQLIGSKLPAESGRGNVFPFINDTWSENGFSSLEAMNNGHKRIADALISYRPTSIMDLGCGNMVLLKRLNALFGCSTFGVDTDEKKNPDLVANIFEMNFDFADFDFALCALQRLDEDPQKAVILEGRIERSGIKHLLLYDYNTGEVQIRTLKETT